MAWVDDRIWCHPKLVDLTDAAFRAWVNGVAYSTGFGTRGQLTAGQQRTIGATSRARRELVGAGLWDETETGIVYHDWDAHNGKRDARREADRERKRQLRNGGTSAGTSAGQTPGTSQGTSTVAARVDGSEGSEEELRAVTALRPADAHDTAPDLEQPFGIKTPELRAT